MTVKTVFNQSYNRDLLPLPIVVKSKIWEHQLASKVFITFILSNLIRFFFVGGMRAWNPEGREGDGTSINTFAYSDLAGNTYNREVNAAHNVIIKNKQNGTLAPTSAVAAPEVSQSVVSSLNRFAAARLPGGRQIVFEMDN